MKAGQLNAVAMSSAGAAVPMRARHPTSEPKFCSRSTTRLRGLSVIRSRERSSADPMVASRGRVDGDACGSQQHRQDVKKLVLGVVNQQFDNSNVRKSTMLVWDDDPSTLQTSQRDTPAIGWCGACGCQPAACRSPPPAVPIDVRRRSALRRSTCGSKPRVRAADKRIINGRPTSTSWCRSSTSGPGRSTSPPARTTGCPGGQHVARDIAAWKDPNGLTEDERRIIKRNLGFFVTADFAGRQQHRAGHLPAHHRARVPPVPAAPGVRGGDPHPRLPVHRRVAGARRGRDLQRVSRGQSIRDKDEFLIPSSTRSWTRTSTPARPRTTSAAEVADRVRLPDGRPVLLRRLHADPRARPAEQDDRRGRAIPVHPARRVDAPPISAST